MMIRPEAAKPSVNQNYVLLRHGASECSPDYWYHGSDPTERESFKT